LLNELALWQVEPGDAAYEQATLEVLKTSPLACRTAGDTRYHDFSSRIMRVQFMPPERRAAALATERELLEHWGKPRSAVQPWPNPLPQDAGMAAVALIRSGGKRPPLALAPHLASSLLAEREGYNDLAWETKCAFQRWWLLVSLAQGDTTAAALNAFRYGTLITATDRFGRQFESEGEPASKAKASARPGYPKLALHFDVTGSTKVSRWRDASGKPERASVTDRNITVRGIRGVRPVAFENTFDELAAQYALKGGAATPGNPEVFEMVWTLEPPAPATKAETKPQGASK
jgi:hypothetical protein